MQIGIIGGIFGDPMETFAESAPEKLLSGVLRERGHRVETFPSTVLPNADVDLYHAHHFSQAAYYLALTKKKPFIFTSHSGFLICDFPFDDSALERRMRALVFRRADRVIALSALEASVLEKKYNVDPQKIRIIHNALPLPLYREKPEFIQKQKTDAFRLLSVGQLEPHKGHVYLLEALVEILKIHPKVQLTIITHNPKLSEEVLRFCRRYGILDHVHLEGSKPTEVLAQFYHDCDVYVQPSLVESFGVTLAEAMACGKPIVAARVGGVEENVGEEAGILVPPRDAKALTGAVLTLLEQPALRTKMGEAGRTRAESRYNEDLFAKKHLDVYTEVMAEGRTGFPGLPAPAGRFLIWCYNRRSRLSWLKKLFPFLN